MKGFLAFAVIGATLAFSAPARAEWTNGTVSQETLVYRQPNDKGEVLGHLRAGKSVRIWLPARGAFYALSFGKVIKGTATGWIPAANVQTDSGVQPPPLGGYSKEGLDAKARAQAQAVARRRAALRAKPNWLDFGLDLNMVSPSDFQTAIGEAPKGVTTMGFSAEYGHRLSGSNLGLVFGAFYYSFKGTGVANSGAEYAAKGFGGNVGLDLQFLNQNQLVISGKATFGMSINNAGNTEPVGTGTNQQMIQFDTSNIVAFPIKVELDVHKYFGGFGLFAGGGYQLATLKDVPIVIADTSPTSDPNNPTQSAANFNLSGLYGRLGVSFNFE
jgi:hypothetical protein